MSQDRQNTPGRAAFTLIELLVVIAIIAVLASLLLPALRNAKDRAHAAVCLGNLKTMGAGITMYSVDTDGWLPVSTSPPDEWNNVLWRYEIARYVGIEATSALDAILGDGIFVCPTWVRVPGLVGTRRAGGYGWNYKYAGYYSPYPNASGERKQVTAFEQPSESILCSDTPDWWGTGGTAGQAYLYPPSDGPGGWAPNPTVGNRHSMGVNLVWADMHVSRMGQNALLSGRNNDIDWYYKRDKP